eukprot:1041083-Karenia_brevis.AAC.1
MIQKYFCVNCMSMPVTDGQWFLFRRANGQQVWICAVCGGMFSARDSPFCVAMKVGHTTQDVLLLKA